MPVLFTASTKWCRDINNENKKRKMEKKIRENEG